MGGVLRTSLLALGLALAWALPASAATWSAPVSLSTAASPVTDRPSVAILDNGTGIETWSENSGGTNVVRVAAHAPGGAWTTLPGTLSGAIPGHGCSPFASIDPAGNALVVWSQWAGSGCNVGTLTMLFATRAAGAAAFTAPSAIGPGVTWAGNSPASVSSNAAGQTVVGYETTDGASKHVFGAFGTPATGFTAPVSLITVSTTPLLNFLTTAVGPSRRCGGGMEHQHQRLQQRPGLGAAGGGRLSRRRLSGGHALREPQLGLLRIACHRCRRQRALGLRAAHVDAGATRC